MEQYVFMTDSDSDLPYALKKQYDIPVVYMPYAMEGKEYFDDLGQTMDHHTYYNRMREGATPVTSALNQADYMEYFEPILKEKDLLFIAFSSQLSCTIQAVYAGQVSRAQIHRGGYPVHLRAHDPAGAQGPRNVPCGQAHGGGCPMGRGQ